MRALRYVVVIAVIMSASASLGARDNRPPEHISVGGSEPLRLWGQAQRTHLLGRSTCTPSRSTATAQATARVLRRLTSRRRSASR
jgi:hypothetical protein